MGVQINAGVIGTSWRKLSNLFVLKKNRHIYLKFVDKYGNPVTPTLTCKYISGIARNLFEFADYL